MKITTFNIRYCNDPDGHSVEERAPRLRDILKQRNADIMGFQEVTPQWLNYLMRDFGNAYEIFNKYRSTTTGIEASTILWRREAFRCLDSGYFWFSDTPWVESMGRDARCNCKRICQWVFLEDVQSGVRFHYMNLHFGFGDAYQLESVAQICQTTDALQTENVFITGDFNMLPHSPAYEKMVAHYTDVNTVTARYTGTTYHEYGKLDNMQIDYCFYKANDFAPTEYRLIDDTVEGKYPSDHYGVMFVFDEKR